MKKYLLILAAMTASLAISAQTPVNLPFDGEDYDIYPIGWTNTSTAAFSYDNWSVDTHDIYDASLNKLFSVAETATTKVIAIEAKNFAPGVTTPYDDTEFYFTQTLFNDDTAFEYLLLEGCEEDEYTGTKITIRSSASSEPLATIEPGGLLNDWVDVFYFGDNEGFYLLINSYNYDTAYWYKWDGKSNSLQMVKADTTHSLLALPNPVKAGEVVTLNLDGTYASCDIVVFSMRGQLVKSVSTSDATLDTKGMAPGRYVYKVASEGQQIGTGKLIIK